jgi:hypothetical protein
MVLKERVLESAHRGQISDQLASGTGDALNRGAGKADAAIGSLAAAPTERFRGVDVMVLRLRSPWATARRDEPLDQNLR